MILFSDNGLLGNDGDIPMKDSVPYYYNYSLDSFLATRKEANDSNGNPYSLAGGKHTRNYGIAITGIMDKESETLPVSISTDCNYEAPEIKVSQQPKPISLALNITVSNLRPHTKYNLYYYTDEKDVPVEKFNKNSKQKPWKHINIDSGTIYTTKLSIDSDKKVFLRAVPADGE